MSICYRFFLLILAILSSPYMQAQGLKNYQYPEAFDPAYDFKPDEALKVYKKMAATKKQEVNGYWVKSIFNTQYQFDCNNMYMDWHAAERYVKQLLDTIIPDTALGKKDLEVFISRGGEIDNIKNEDGIIYINIFSLAQMNNESTLSYFLAHHAAHYLLKHQKKMTNKVNVLNEKNRYEFFLGLNKAEEQIEAEADNYAGRCMMRLGMSPDSVKKELAFRYEHMRLIRKLGIMSDKNEQLTSVSDFKRNSYYGRIQSHCYYGEGLARLDPYIKKTRYKGKELYVLDSVLFKQLRRISEEETKKILFEDNLYQQALYLSFVDYMRRPKDLKNLYFVIESLRRFMYIDPGMIDRPFLMGRTNDEKLYNSGMSILDFTDCAYITYEQYLEVRKHPFLTGLAPFKTYRQAFGYFTALALKYDMNEPNLSKALFFYQQKDKDSLDFYLEKYISKGNGLYTDFAKSFKGSSQPSLPGNRMCILVDNTGNYSGTSFNYYLCRQRMQYNKQTRSTLVTDTAGTDLVMLNELMGRSPKELNWYQRIENSILELYSEEDIQLFRKIRLSSREKQDEFGLSHKFNKHLLVLAPEFYPWFSEHKYNRIFFVEALHQSEEYMEDKELYNTYTGYYLDMNALRPYFKDAVRIGMKLKQSNASIYSELADFLYGRE